VGIQIAPSILSADFTNLESEIARIDGADMVHVDVMDNHFVPNLTIGLPVVDAIITKTSLPVDCHLMIEDPDRWAPGYADAGAQNVTFHAEAAAAPVRLAREIRRLGSRVGVGFRPATSLDAFEDLLAEIDTLLVMTVEPGFGGQSFIQGCVPKIRRARGMAARSGFDIQVQVDGGVSAETIEQCAEAGADVFVAGSAVYSADDAASAIDELRSLAAGPAHHL